MIILLKAIFWPGPWLWANLKSIPDIRKNTDGKWDLPPFCSNSPIVDAFLIFTVVFALKVFMKNPQYEIWAKVLIAGGLYTIGGYFRYRYEKEGQLKGRERDDKGDNNLFPFSSAQATVLGFIIYVISI